MDDKPTYRDLFRAAERSLVNESHIGRDQIRCEVVLFLTRSAKMTACVACGSDC
jgi:hypothetical protein